MSATCVDFEMFQSVSALKRVTRSHRSSAWPIPFYGHFPTSQSGTVAGPREESSPRGTEAVCLCSGPVGRSHTVDAGRKADRSRKGGMEGWRAQKGRKNKELINVIFRNMIEFESLLLSSMPYKRSYLSCKFN